jgi:RimJ/RimL family protein N-acetyltransferase
MKINEHTGTSPSPTKSKSPTLTAHSPPNAPRPPGALQRPPRANLPRMDARRSPSHHPQHLTPPKPLNSRPNLQTPPSNPHSQEIQKATASEPLTLAEEHAMQRSWRLDADKLTFIVCAAPTEQQGAVEADVAPEHDAPERMVGDVNLFLFADDEDEDEEEGSKTDGTSEEPVIGELEIMIARVEARGKGMARETLCAFMWYITSSLSGILGEYRAGEGRGRVLKYLRVKIDKDNVPSLGLFERVGFKRTSAEPNYFGEVEMRTPVVGGRLVDVEAKIGLEGLTREVRYENRE